jgi:hypothetical protein
LKLFNGFEVEYALGVFESSVRDAQMVHQVVHLHESLQTVLHAAQQSLLRNRLKNGHTSTLHTTEYTAASYSHYLDRAVLGASVSRQELLVHEHLVANRTGKQTEIVHDGQVAQLGRLSDRHVTTGGRFARFSAASPLLSLQLRRLVALHKIVHSRFKLPRSQLNRVRIKNHKLHYRQPHHNCSPTFMDSNDHRTGTKVTEDNRRHQMNSLIKIYSQSHSTHTKKYVR